jgi:HEAT repeat protein
MNTANERRLVSPATELGESADAAFPELAQYTRSESPLVRRLAASMLRKLAGIVGSAVSVDLLRPLLADAHSQVQQYDNRGRIVKGYAIRPDFYLPEFDLYIEYLGMEDNLDSQIGMMEKKKLYQQAGKKLISLYAHKKTHLRDALQERRSLHAKLQNLPTEGGPQP